MSDERAVLTVDEAADRLGVSPRLVRQAIRAGQIPGSVLGTGKRQRYLVPAEAFARYLAGEWRSPARDVAPATIPFVVRRNGPEPRV